MTEEVTWVKWHFSKWRGDPALRMCSLSARGLWADLLSFMHECQPYGHLLVGGRAPTPRQIASLVGMTSEREVSACLVELLDNGVCGVTDDGVIFSRRMVRDKVTREKARAYGKEGGNPNITPRQERVNPPLNGTVVDQVNIEKEKEKKREEYPPTPLAGETKAKRLRNGRAQIKADWQPDEAGIAYAKSRSAPHDGAAITAFRDHHLSRGSLMADWAAAWRTWCNNAVRFGRTEPSLFQADTDDPWGINAWIARQPDVVDDPVGIGTPDNPRPCKTINKWAVVAHAEAVAEAAGLPTTWRGDWDYLGRWFREDRPLNERAVLEAISSRAQWFREKGGPVSAIKSFDTCVKDTTCRPAGSRA